MIGPYIDKASLPKYFIICLLNKMVKIPIATSIKKVEKPVMVISFIFLNNSDTLTSFKVFLSLLK